MAYNNTYDAGDTAKIAVDLIVGVGSALFSFVTLIGLVLLYRFLKGKKVNI
jgi:hypothetical protein